MKIKANTHENWLTKGSINKLQQRLKILDKKAKEHNIISPKLIIFPNQSIDWKKEQYYRVLLEFFSESLGDIKHEGYTLRFNGILEVEPEDQQGFTIGDIIAGRVAERYLKWCLEKKCLMCDHCGIAVRRKFVSEYLIVGTNKRLYFGTTCDQTVVGEVIRLYLKVVDNWFNPEREGYLYCDINNQKKTRIMPAHCQDLKELNDGVYTITMSRDYHTGKVINILGQNNYYWSENERLNKLQPGGLFRKISIKNTEEKDMIHSVPCDCKLCLSMRRLG